MSSRAGITTRQAKMAYAALKGREISRTVNVSKSNAKVVTEQVVKTVEVIKKVPFIVTKPVIKEVKVIKEVPIKVTKEVVVIKEVRVPVVQKVEVIKEVKVPVIKKVQVIKEVKVPVEKIVYKADEKALNALSAKYAKLEARLADAKKQLKEKPKTIIKEVEVIKEVPVEIIKEVEVVKSLDFAALQKMMKGVKTVEVSKTVVGESRTRGTGKVVERREVKDGNRTKVQAKPSVVSKTSTTTASKSVKKTKGDDLTKIEGIGPAIQKLLHGAGIKTFKELSDMKISSIQAILSKGGPKFQMHTPGSWPKQADLAANGKWDQLKKLQDLLNGGK